MLRVLCSESELGEYGVVVTVGEHISRLAARIEEPYYGTDLDTIEWRFDQYADAIGYESATISGTVAAISAVYVQLTSDPEGGWKARPGSAHLEPLDTTSATRKIEPVIEWGPPLPPRQGRPLLPRRPRPHPRGRRAPVRLGHHPRVTAPRTQRRRHLGSKPLPVRWL